MDMGAMLATTTSTITLATTLMAIDMDIEIGKL